ncbi:hypothetical protein BKA60DRAFT_469583 [Fusarium oxysporum]|nr:hypothetical protein BKA60DRAFT_469583 [Fusarium oxysporum]
MDHNIFRYGLIQGASAFSSRSNDNIAYVTRNGTVSSVRNDDGRFLAALQSTLQRFDIEKPQIQHISTKSGLEVIDDCDIYTILFDPEAYNGPEVLRADPQRPNNVIDKDTSAGSHASSPGGDRQHVQGTQDFDGPTEDATGDDRQIVHDAEEPDGPTENTTEGFEEHRISNEDMEKKIGDCLSENRTSPYEVTELCAMFPGCEPESLVRAWYRVRERMVRKKRTELSSLHG